MSLRIKSIDLEQMRLYNFSINNAPKFPPATDYIGGIVLEDGEATMRFKPTKEQCDLLWTNIESIVIDWAKALINGETSNA